MISQAALDQLRADNPCDVIAGQWVTLRRHGQGWIGPCPVCSPNRQSRDATKFEVTADKWLCAHCSDGGDVIKLVQKVEGLDFIAAIEWLGGVREVDTAAAAEADKRRAEEREKSDRDNNEFRERERGRIFEMWRRGSAIQGTPVEVYLRARGLAIPSGIKLRAFADMPYYASGKRDAEEIHRGPAMLAPIVGIDRKFRGLHTTWLAPDGATKAVIIDPQGGDTLLPAKKVRGSKAGHFIELVPAPGAMRRLVIGEGIETVLSVWTVLASIGNRDLSQTAFWSSVDLGNLAGRAERTIAHPSLKTANGRMQLVPGPISQPASPAVAVPDSVEELIILGDADSDPFTTRCAIARAAVRHARADRTVRVAWPPAGMDFNDVLRGTA